MTEAADDQAALDLYFAMMDESRHHEPQVVEFLAAHPEWRPESRGPVRTTVRRSRWGAVNLRDDLQPRRAAAVALLGALEKTPNRWTICRTASIACGQDRCDHKLVDLFVIPRCGAFYSSHLRLGTVETTSVERRVLREDTKVWHGPDRVLRDELTLPTSVDEWDSEGVVVPSRWFPSLCDEHGLIKVDAAVALDLATRRAGRVHAPDVDNLVLS